MPTGHPFLVSWCKQVTDAKTLHIATIGKPHGIKGEVRVKAYLQEPLRLADYKPLRDETGAIHRITRLRPEKALLVVKLQGINSRNEAETLNGTKLYVDRGALDDETDEDEFYAADLIGLAVRDAWGKTLGEIIAVPDFGAGDLLEIEPSDGGASWYLAFTRENVPVVDSEAEFVTINPPPEID